MTNAPCCRSAGSVREVASRAMSMSGGSVESPRYAWVRRPLGRPSASSVATMTTPVGNDPEIRR